MLKYAVRNRLTSELVARPTDAVLYFPGYPGYGSIIKDYSGQSNDGAITQAVWTRLSSGLWTLDFDGLDDVVTITHAASLSIADNQTFHIWMKATAYTQYMKIASKDDGTHGWYIGLGNTLPYDRIIFTVRDVDAGYHNVEFDYVFALNTWYCVHCLYENFTPKLYVNGVSEQTGSSFTKGIGSNTASFLVSVTGALAFEGSLALLRLYNQALTAGEITNHFNQERHLFGV